MLIWEKIFLFFLLNHAYRRLTNAISSPVLIWGGKIREMPTLPQVKFYEFKMLVENLLQHHAIVAFIENELTIRDFGCVQPSNGNTCYEYLSTLTPNTFYNLVESPSMALNSIQNASIKKLFLRDNNEEEMMEAPCEIGKIYLYYLSNDIMLDNWQNLQIHDAILERFSRKAYCKNAMFFYMAAVSFADFHYRNRERESSGNLLDNKRPTDLSTFGKVRSLQKRNAAADDSDGKPVMEIDDVREIHISDNESVTQDPDAKPDVEIGMDMPPGIYTDYSDGLSETEETENEKEKDWLKRKEGEKEAGRRTGKSETFGKSETEESKTPDTDHDTTQDFLAQQNGTLLHLCKYLAFYASKVELGKIARGGMFQTEKKLNIRKSVCTSTGSNSFAVILLMHEPGDQIEFEVIESERGFHIFNNFMFHGHDVHTADIKIPHLDYSFTCNSWLLRVLQTSDVIRVKQAQFEVLHDFEHFNKFRFHEGWTCSSLTSPGIMAGLMTSALLIGVASIAIVMLLNIKVSGSYDDPNRLPLEIATN